MAIQRKVLQTKGKKVQMIELPKIRCNGKQVYLEESEGYLRAGPLGLSYDPYDFVRTKFATKGERRKFRKQLFAAGHRDIAAQTIQTNPSNLHNN